MGEGGDEGETTVAWRSSDGSIQLPGAIEVTENQDVQMILLTEATDVADVLTMINQEEDAQKTLTLAILVRTDQDVLEEEINNIIKSSEFYSGLF